MANCLSMFSRARPRRRVTSLPSTKICPASGFKMPSTLLIITDLPVPEPPITTRLSPLAILGSRPSSTTLGPKRFLTPRSSALGVLLSVIGLAFEEDGGEEVVRGEDQDRRRHDSVGRCRADA